MDGSCGTELPTLAAGRALALVDFFFRVSRPRFFAFATRFLNRPFRRLIIQSLSSHVIEREYTSFSQRSLANPNNACAA